MLQAPPEEVRHEGPRDA